MISLVLVPILAALSRMAGGGLGAWIFDKKEKGGLTPFNLTWVPEAVFSIIAAVSFYHDSHLIIQSIAALWIYVAIQLGHGTIYNMKGWQSSNPNRIQTIEYPVRPVFRIFKWSIYTPGYSWACMGFKGFLIGLPLFPLGLLLIVLWPLSYAIRGPVLGEWLSGAALGVCLLLWRHFPI